MPIIDASSFGGAVVRRHINRAVGALRPGDLLSADDLRAMPIGNLRALIDNHTIEPWPASAGDPAMARELADARAQIDAQAERIRELEAGHDGGDDLAVAHIVHAGRGLYDVIVGRKLTEAPLPKDAAEAIAEGAVAADLTDAG
jgi:hypothetical protein